VLGVTFSPLLCCALQFCERRFSFERPVALHRSGRYSSLHTVCTVVRAAPSTVVEAACARCLHCSTAPCSSTSSHSPPSDMSLSRGVDTIQACTPLCGRACCATRSC
jgi:hypothetical protein